MIEQLHVWIAMITPVSHYQAEKVYRSEDAGYFASYYWSSRDNGVSSSAVIKILWNQASREHIFLNSYSRMRVYLAAHAGTLKNTLLHCCISRSLASL
jgi:hypothetical protein